MPVGCQFICMNKECKSFNTGFTMTSPWPLGNIDDVLNSKKVINDELLHNKLIKDKEDGRELACISLPNDEHIEIKGYRVQKWHVKDKFIVEADVLVYRDETFEDALARRNIPDADESGNQIISFQYAVDEGIDCPVCKKMLTEKRWFANE